MMILIKIVYVATSLCNLSKFFYGAFGILFTCSLFQLYIYFRDTLSGKSCDVQHTKKTF